MLSTKSKSYLKRKVVITGLVPVIHAFGDSGRVDGGHVDGRTKSGHDDRAALAY